MKEDISLLILAAQQHTRQSITDHQHLARACQRVQDAVGARLRLRLGHSRRWHINGAEWRLERADVWVSANIEFSEPTLTAHLYLTTDAEPGARLHLLMERRLGLIRTDEEFSTEVCLPTTLPATRPVRLHFHTRARSWKTYPEVTLR